jgi:hypothetical protein
MLSAVRRLLDKVKAVQKIVFTWVFLNFIYVLGIGLTSVVGRVFGFQFITKPKKASSWQTHARSINVETMY